jgi:flagellar protein FliS
MIRQKDVNLESCERVVRGLMSSFQEVAKQDDSGPVMENTQQVYAGLTYGKGSLNEVALNTDRGFRV